MKDQINIIETKGLTKKYGSCTALCQADLTVRRGDIYGLIGDNGAGKTTFLKLITGQIFPSEGEMRLFGRYASKDLLKERRRTGVIIEAPGFYPQMTVKGNLEYYRLQKGVPGKTAVQAAMDMTGLSEYEKKHCKDLSLGMKQRLGLAIALLGEPELLILDEPINGLDPSGIIEIRGLLKKLNQEKNMTIILSSHILTELQQLSTTYGFLHKGRLVEQISEEKLHEKCRGYIELILSDVESYTCFLEKNLNHKDYQVLEGGRIHIFNPDREVESYSRAAAEAGIGISGLNVHQMTLEEYYMDLKEGRKGA